MARGHKPRGTTMNLDPSSSTDASMMTPWKLFGELANMTLKLAATSLPSVTRRPPKDAGGRTVTLQRAERQYRLSRLRRTYTVATLRRGGEALTVRLGSGQGTVEPEEASRFVRRGADGVLR